MPDNPEVKLVLCFVFGFHAKLAMSPGSAQQCQSVKKSKAVLRAIHPPQGTFRTQAPYKQRLVKNCQLDRRWGLVGWERLVGGTGGNQAIWNASASPCCVATMVRKWSTNKTLSTPWWLFWWGRGDNYCYWWWGAGIRLSCGKKQLSERSDKIQDAEAHPWYEGRERRWSLAVSH